MLLPLRRSAATVALSSEVAVVRQGLPRAARGSTGLPASEVAPSSVPPHVSGVAQAWSCVSWYCCCCTCCSWEDRPAGRRCAAGRQPAASGGVSAACAGQALTESENAGAAESMQSMGVRELAGWGRRGGLTWAASGVARRCRPIAVSAPQRHVLSIRCTPVLLCAVPIPPPSCWCCSLCCLLKPLSSVRLKQLRKRASLLLPPLAPAVRAATLAARCGPASDRGR